MKELGFIVSAVVVSGELWHSEHGGVLRVGMIAATLWAGYLIAYRLPWRFGPRKPKPFDPGVDDER